MGELQDHAKEHNQLVISYRMLQRLLGILGLALPLSLIAFSWVEGRPIEASISDFYYTKMGGVLVGTLCAVGIFLICYNGYPEERRRLWSDRTISLLAGVFAIGVALFPVHRPGLIPPPGGTADPEAGDVAVVFYGFVNHPNTLHYGSAAAFFACIAIFTLVFFPRGEEGMTLRRLVYYACGGTMVLAILRMALLGVSGGDAPGGHALFIWETVAILAFSVAWLAKGKIDAPITLGLKRFRSQAV